MNGRPRCPACGAGRIIPIRYGMPGPEMWAEVDRGEVALGGCVIEPDSPCWRCVVCGRAFGSFSAGDGTSFQSDLTG